MIHVNSSVLSGGGVYALTVSELVGLGRSDRAVVFDGSRSKGFAVSVKRTGNSAISFRSTGSLRHLTTDDQLAFPVTIEGDNLFSDVKDVPMPLPTPSAEFLFPRKPFYIFLYDAFLIPLVCSS
jgi:hypothetical protein